MALRVYENILGLQIPIDYIFVVEVVDRLHNLSQVKFDDVLGQRLPHLTVKCFE